MKNRFTITITDINGSRHFLLHQIIKRFLLYFMLAIVLLIIIGSISISFLVDRVSDFEQKREIMLKEQEFFKEKNRLLIDEVAQKSQEYAQIQEKITDIEELVGIIPAQESQIDERLENIKLTSTQQNLFFNNIPNGEVVPFTGFSGKFGWRVHPILKTKEFHRGLDMRADMMTPVKAPADGVVEYAGYHESSGFGNLVIIEHNFGFKTSYAHLSKKFPFKAGDFVKKGQIIAYTGSSGLSTGPHLHYEVRFVTRPLDPLNFVQWDNTNFEQIFKKEKRVSWQSLIKQMDAQLVLLRQP